MKKLLIALLLLPATSLAGEWRMEGTGSGSVIYGTTGGVAVGSSGGGGYALQPATVTIQANFGISGSTVSVSTVTALRINTTGVADYTAISMTNTGLNKHKIYSSYSSGDNWLEFAKQGIRVIPRGATNSSTSGRRRVGLRN
mgnify:CR=1 FL=1